MKRNTGATPVAPDSRISGIYRCPPPAAVPSTDLRGLNDLLRLVVLGSDHPHGLHVHRPIGREQPAVRGRSRPGTVRLLRASVRSADAVLERLVTRDAALGAAGIADHLWWNRRLLPPMLDVLSTTRSRSFRRRLSTGHFHAMSILSPIQVAFRSPSWRWFLEQRVDDPVYCCTCSRRSPSRHRREPSCR